MRAPFLDDPITDCEIKVVFKNIIKCGYDYDLPILNALVTSFTLHYETIYNMIFFLKYPVSLARSLLAIMSKKRNLMLPKIFIRFQMMKVFTCFFVRIISNRLKLWLSFNANQSAFQKGKSTLIHIFTIRILIEIVEKKEMTLYIGTIDNEKAFDHVPRSLLLKQLGALGIRKCILFVLKQVHS